MAYLIGIDEAGYGPNLGPLVIGASAWRVRDVSIDLFDTLSGAISSEVADDRIAIADSKRLYKPGSGWRLLERGVLGALTASGAEVVDAGQLITSLAAEQKTVTPASPWRRAEPMALPANATADEIATVGDQLADACSAAGVSPPTLRARLVQPAEFNTLIDEYGTKGAALSHVTLALLRRVIDEISEEASPYGPVSCVLDKHGGRNRYAGLIQHHFPEHWIETLVESRAESRYRSANLEFGFRSGGEAFLPTALASMTAKLLREIEMQRFNQFWQSYLPDLKSTAGYPVDAKRFKAEIAAKQAELGIDDHTLWRKR